MDILAHRGYWKREEEKNSLQALKAAMTHGYGFETDVRDYSGRLVISHNVATASSQMASIVFADMARMGGNNTFAINIKADGLGDLLEENLNEYGITNYFLFDMSVPQMVYFAEKRLVFFTRQSDVEPVPIMLDKAAGVWMDSFTDSELPTIEMIKSNLSKGKRVCLVSPELHGRDPIGLWQRLKANSMVTDERLLLCTDLPDDASDFFGIK
ncbi:hypothetical protein [Selenomonas ruminantium]|uniref:hypothetical protein n=1 Tax=Selenomonas ruminantium TaxID=971 RepID=UPI0026F0795F|nr:hypothetical protein [Selenomonas ruminantium]